MPTHSPAIDLLPQLTSAYCTLLAVKDSMPPASNWYGDSAHRDVSERLALVRSALCGSDIQSIAVRLMRAADGMRALLIQCSPSLMEQHKVEARATIDRIHDLAWAAKGAYMRAVSDLLKSIPEQSIQRGYSSRRGEIGNTPRVGKELRSIMVKLVDRQQITNISYADVYDGSFAITVTTTSRTYELIANR